MIMSELQKRFVSGNDVPVTSIRVSKEEFVKLSKEFYSNQDDSIFLSCLQGAGVDNWSGYEVAQELASSRDNDEH